MKKLHCMINLKKSNKEKKRNKEEMEKNNKWIVRLGNPNILVLLLIQSNATIK